MSRFIHYTELPAYEPNTPLCAEWNVYRHEAGHLIAEGYQGKWILIKGEEIIGIWETEAEALDEGYRRYLLQPFLVHQIMTWERVYVQTFRFRSWHS